MRYFLFSAFIHLVIVITGLSLFKDSLDFHLVGEPAVTFSMVGESFEISGHTEDMVTGKPATEENKPEPVKEETAEEKPREPEETVEEPITEDEIKEPEPEVPEEATAEVEEVTEALPQESGHSAEEAKEMETSENKPETSDSEETPQGEEALGEGLVQLEDGTIAAVNQGVRGLEYGFISQPEPAYPAAARRMGVGGEVIIKARFLIGYDGRVEEVKFYDDITNFGFREEVERALRNWRATPITVDGKQVKLYFYKSFKFELL